MKSRLPILKNSTLPPKNHPSTFIDFLDFFHPPLHVYCIYVLVFFQKIPPSTFIPTSTVIRDMRVNYQENCWVELEIEPICFVWTQSSLIQCFEEVFFMWLAFFSIVLLILIFVILFLGFSHDKWFLILGEGALIRKSFLTLVNA